jgi:hypothetical protein
MHSVIWILQIYFAHYILLSLTQKLICTDRVMAGDWLVVIARL